MEQLILFNGVKILLTTGQSEAEVQSHWDKANVVISVYQDDLRILKSSGSLQVKHHQGRLFVQSS